MKRAVYKHAHDYIFALNCVQHSNFVSHLRAHTHIHTHSHPFYANTPSKMLRRSLRMLNWRDQGVSYVKYLNVCTETLHMTVKDKARAKYAKFSSPNYVAIKSDGAGGVEEVKKVPAFTKDY